MRHFFKTCAGLALLLGLLACEDETIGTDDPDSGLGAVCEARRRDAGPVPRCAADEQCCSREACNTTTGICYPLDACQVNADCPQAAQGQVCRDEDGDGYKDCVFDRCTENEECAATPCPPDQIPACISGGCACGIPCQGGCTEGQGCCIPDDTCYPLPEACMGLTCPPGQFVSVTTPGAWNTGTCEFTGESCRCERLPPLPVGDVGLYSAMVHTAQGPVVSAYNLTYGDLMFGRVDPSTRAIAWSFVDGVPSAGGTITGDVDGPRGGNSAPGPDVGIYTDVLVDSSGLAHIAYHDRDARSLKYAVGSGSTWQTHVVASAPVAGLYTELVMSGGGRPMLVYLAHQEDTPGQPGQRRSVLRLAVANTPQPAQSSDWSFRDLLTTDLSSMGCADRCREGEVCRSSDDLCFAPEPSACTGPCPSRTACIEAQCQDVRAAAPFKELPKARGLWPSAGVLGDGTTVVAFFDNLDTSVSILRIASADPLSGAIDVVTVDGQAEDAGRFPSLYALPGGELHLAYYNHSQRSLEYRQLDAALAITASERVASGLDSGVVPGGSFVGTEPALVVDSVGVVRVAFQDSTLGLLRYARRTGPNTWSIRTLRGDEAMNEGSFGFYTNQILDANRQNPMISTYRYWLSALPDPNNGLEVLLPPE